MIAQQLNRWPRARGVSGNGCLSDVAAITL
jgi:hypothetical protein